MRPSPTVRAERRIVHVAASALCLAGFVAAAGASGSSASSALGVAVVASAAAALLVRLVRVALGRAWARLMPPAPVHACAATKRTERTRPVLTRTATAHARDAA